MSREKDVDVRAETPGWAEYSRRGLAFASSAASAGFYVAEKGTKLGFFLARGITTTAITIGTTVSDHVIFGSNVGTGLLLNSVANAGLSAIEALALAPIHIGQAITSTSLVAVQASVDKLTRLLGTDDASFSLVSFVHLVRREWQTPTFADKLPETRYSVAEVAGALVAWASIQASTAEYTEQLWVDHVEEVGVDWAEVKENEAKAEADAAAPVRPKSDVVVTSDTILPDEGGEIWTADIGHESNPTSASVSGHETPEVQNEPANPYTDLFTTLRRLSKIVLGGYGGAGLIFFGVPLPPPRGPAAGEKRILEDAVNASEADPSSAEPDPNNEIPPTEASKTKDEALKFGWWDLVRGKHDQELFEHYAFSADPGAKDKDKTGAANVSTDERLPRYWILNDHSRKQVVLVLRGTMSLNELAIDLTCDSMPFEPAWAHPVSSDTSPHLVHSGMYLLAQLMGSPRQPVHAAVRSALLKHPGYELILCGHSLGAGLAAMLALMWADPLTCLTVKEGGLPRGRRVSAYCIAPPCLTSPELSRLSSNLITSFVCSHDVVSRLSLGSVRDMVLAASWLCEGEESCSNIVSRAVQLQTDLFSISERQKEEEKQWFLSLRKTLEANMQMTELYPTGRVLWAIRKDDMFNPSSKSPDREWRLFRVKLVEKVFNRIVFTRDTLSSHMPHQYDKVLHEYL